NNSSSDSAINTRSSAYNNSHGSPHLDCIDSASNTIINNRGLSTEPWCTPTFTSKSSLILSFALTAVFTPSYIDCITLTNHSSTFSFLRTTKGSFLAPCQMPSLNPQRPSTTLSSYINISPAAALL